MGGISLNLLYKEANKVQLNLIVKLHFKFSLFIYYVH